MKCPNCGGEIEPGNLFCGSCGSQISLEMKKEQEQINKVGCPKCGSSNVTFNREKNGEFKGKKGTAIIRSTVGFCKDCGYTWQTTEQQKKRKTWLWVLGWIFIFPLPLTIILLKKKNLKPAIKYGIIAAAWVLFLVFVFVYGGSGDTSTSQQSTTQNTTVPISVATTTTAPITTTMANDTETTQTTDTTTISAETTVKQEETTESKEIIELIAGQIGEYGKEIIMGEGTEFEEHLVVYYLPAGKYTVKNLGQYMTQVTVYKGFERNPDTGYDEYTDSGDVILINPGEEGAIEVPDGWFIEIHEPTHISLIPLS